MNFYVLTLFPNMFNGVLSESMLGRAVDNGILNFEIYNIRDFANNKHNRVDDTPYGGGRGMVMQAPPVFDAYEHIRKKLKNKPYTIYMSPKGTVFNQQKAIELSKKENLLFICGHYEGLDQRVIDEIVDEEISIGDYVLTGGEIPAMTVMDAVSRMIEGVLSNEESFIEESHFSGLLEYPQYTRPFSFHDVHVPSVLTSGNHAEINKWRHEQALLITKEKRPDMYEEYVNTHREEFEPKKKKRKSKSSGITKEEG